ncbi:3-hydroxyacyl-CoA dehydrogenase NAD-binding domain-containing protein [Methyloligella sp. 2.7D]|uniref:3-hydroxyacyl-CoA dehydrogenase NAD-binding domain-containing protein n=1 Tax=unclassified Methyloligella TaxID=2625955 RepID=UPI001FEF644E|nr:3-hydroxyacyl-CoA dehydrogenase NAD-binding domain-containing protein [Methyloligella sp. GL2]
MNVKHPLRKLKDWRFEVDYEGVAWATFDREGESVNSLGRRPLEELATIVDKTEELAAKGEVKGLVIISAKDNFIVGADIREFEAFDTEDKVKEALSGPLALLDKIEAMKVPVVAAIHGYCLGGGLELALACHYRIADRDEATRLGFPEVKLGIFPGLNGTVRAIKAAGPLDAMTAMLTAKMLRPSAARAIGLVDQLVPSRHGLRWAARKAVLKNRRSKGAGLTKRLMAKSPARGLLVKKMREKTAAKVREDHYPAPFRLIDLFEEHGDNLAEMKTAETEAFAPLMASETSRNLRRVFKLSELLKAEAPKQETGLGAFVPRRVHVIGAGTMGADIAAWCVVSGMEASLQDLDEAQIEKGIARGHGLFKKRLRSRAEQKAAMSRLIADPKGAHIGRADVVIEAIVEKLDVKQALFRDLETKLKPGAVLATNTSSLKLEDIAAGLSDPGRLIGLHFFNPVAQLPLVEVVRGDQSREEEVKKACLFVVAINKMPLIVKSCPGFLVNRVLAPYMMEAAKQFEHGQPREKIDQAAVKFGMPMGPLELMDMVGLDICKHVGETLGLAGEDGEHVLARLVKDGKLGKKSGEGFYVWKDGKAEHDKEAEYPPQDLDKLGRELIKPMLEEAERARDEKIVESADLVDAGVIFGTGFAPFLGGPLHYRATEDNKQSVAA